MEMFFSALCTLLPGCSVPVFVFVDFTDVQLNLISCMSTKEFLMSSKYILSPKHKFFLFVMLFFLFFVHILLRSSFSINSTYYVDILY